MTTLGFRGILLVAQNAQHAEKTECKSRPAQLQNLSCLQISYTIKSVAASSVTSLAFHLEKQLCQYDAITNNDNIL